MGRTNQQDVVAAKDKIAELKAIYMDEVESYLKSNNSSDQILLDRLIKCQRSGNAYFNYVEEFVGNSSLLGAHEDSLWAQGFAEDCAQMLKTLPNHIELLKVGFKKYSTLDLNALTPGNTAYANMQRMVVKYLSHSEAMEIKKIFSDLNFPIYGFKNEAKEFMSKRLQTILSFIFGTSFVLLLIAIAFIEPNPSSFQYTIFRVVLALAGGGVVAVFPGFIEVKLGNWLRAGGALAVFVIIFFWNPALPNEKTAIDKMPNRVAGGVAPPAPTTPCMRLRTGRFIKVIGPKPDSESSPTGL